VKRKFSSSTTAAKAVEEQMFILSDDIAFYKVDMNS
jgi:hypothetical protein